MTHFALTFRSPHWLSDPPEDVHDLCLHGHAAARIGGHTVEYDCTLSAAGLYLLRTLTEDHIPEWDTHGYEPLLPCCGHELFAVEGNPDAVAIFGCGQGATWAVRHCGSNVVLTADGQAPVTLPLSDYRREILRFCDEIEDFYHKSASKAPSSPYEADGYTAFWLEWHMRRSS